MVLLTFGLAFAVDRCEVTILPGEAVRTAMDDAIGKGCSVHLAAGVHTVTNRLGYTLSGTE
ncbi:MAG: hypothetical protein AAF602_20010, partial [Myxococcota bacterium]